MQSKLKTKPSKYEPGEVVYDLETGSEITFIPEVPMYNENQEARSRLLNRVQNQVYSTQQSLQEKFGLSWQPPTNAAELIEAIEKKKYVAPSLENQSSKYLEWFGIEFRDPKIVKDKEGYKAAEKKLHEAAEKVGDEIFVLPPADGLEAFRKFEVFIEKMIK